MPTSSQIRQQFVDFFVQNHQHSNIKSSPVVPHNDPTLLFTNAGMNQFKPYFLGTENPEVTRAVNTQKCIRAGGKHNDLDDVGRDTYHHTFFEMLGNWSFGDYFKQDAIRWAWELLTSAQYWGIDPERLHASYFEGDASEGLEPDLEAKALWEEFLPPERIHPGNKKDNFWEMGETGPCGPCSELHYDRSPDKSCGHLVNADDQDTVVEIWNLVFIQFNRSVSGKLESLPAKHVDTGMGFERIVRVLQGKDSNYDTDVFTPLFTAIQSVTGARGYEGGPDSLKDSIDTAYRVIADHIRTLTFSLADGAHCGNKGRDAVLRTVLRRAVRYGHQQLGVEEPFLYKLVPAVVEAMGEAFPEIVKPAEAIQKELRDEEIDFRRTLARGIVLFEKVAEPLSSGAMLDGATAHDLEATFGFPVSLTQVMASERGLTVDMPGYDEARQKHADVSRAGGSGADLGAKLIELVQQHDLPAVTFLGYDATSFTGEAEVRVFDLGDVTAIVVDQTPFYGESGGQVGDTGSIAFDGAAWPVRDTQKVGSTTFHITEGGVSGSSGRHSVTLKVDEARRAKIENNHTSTHLLNRALRDHVNPDAMQKGSLVDDHKLRFDFSQDQALTPEQVAAVEAAVNADIEADLAVNWQVADQEAALQIAGLRAVFGEKYPPKVRVVSVGPKVDELLSNPGSPEWANRSIEFCGGTHLKSTGAAKQLVVLSQEAVSKGVRRMTALTGDVAEKAAADALDVLKTAQDLAAHAEPTQEAIESLNQTLADTELPLVVRTKVQASVDQIQEKRKAMAKAASQQAAAGAVDVARTIADEADPSAGYIVATLEADGGAVRSAMDVISQRHPETAIMLFGKTADKVAIMAAVPKALIAKGLKAGDWVKQVAPVVGGGGGGKPDRAQAGGKDPSKIAEAEAKAREVATAALG